MLATETETRIIDMATELPSPMPCYDTGVHPKKKLGTIVEQYECVPKNFRVTDPEPLCTNMNHIENVMMILTDF